MVFISANKDRSVYRASATLKDPGQGRDLWRRRIDQLIGNRSGREKTICWRILFRRHLLSRHRRETPPGDHRERSRQRESYQHWPKEEQILCLRLQPPKDLGRPARRWRMY